MPADIDFVRTISSMKMRTTAAALILVALTFQALPATASTSALKDPTSNFAYNPNPLSSGPCQASCPDPCWYVTATGPKIAPNTNTKSCNAYVLLSTNAARAKESLRAFSLPSNFYSLTPAEQMFVVIDEERVSRGLAPYLGLERSLDQVAASGAKLGTDPRLPASIPAGPVGWGSIWAGTYSVLMADFGWMYQDGWGGSVQNTANIDCTSPVAKSCWGHRHVILSLGTTSGLRCQTCVMGAAYAPPTASHSYGNYAAIFMQPAAATPSLYFTWQNNVKPYLPAKTN